MKRVLITGANGFIGSQALSLFSTHEYEIHAVTSRPVPQQQGHIHWHQCNLLDGQQTQKLLAALRPTHLLHFAWVVTPGSFWSAPENKDWIQASLDLLAAFTAHGGERAVFAGSCAEYEWQHGGYCSETQTPTSNPATLYGQCKSSLRVLCENHVKQSDCSFAWGRIFFTFGPSEPPNRLVSSVIRALLSNTPALCSPGTQIRDFLYVEDVASAFMHLLDSDVTGAMNVGSGASRYRKRNREYDWAKVKSQRSDTFGCAPFAGK